MQNEAAVVAISTEVPPKITNRTKDSAIAQLGIYPNKLKPRSQMQLTEWGKTFANHPI